VLFPANLGLAAHEEAYSPLFSKPGRHCDADSRGKHSALRGLCRRIYHDQEPGPDVSVYHDRFDLAWHECYTIFSDSPCTKACKCLHDVFKIKPDPSLCGYVINPEPEDYAETSAYLQSIGCRLQGSGKFNAVILHYEGNTSSGKKNLDHHTARAVCAETIAAGYIPVLLDWDRRSPLPDGKTIFCPGAHSGDIWGGFGSGDAARIAALICQAALFVGIDSGPGKVAASTATPNISVWTGHHPIQFHDLTRTHHLVPEHHETIPPAQNKPAADYFRSNYDFATYPPGGLTEKLCQTVRRMLGKESPVEDGLTMFAGFWCHADRVEQDWTIIEDVFFQDCYKLRLLDPDLFTNVVDIGAHIGTFAHLVKKLNPSARVICVEVAAENIEPLRRNVAERAEAVHACVVGERTGPVKLHNSFTTPGTCRSTGGSTVVPLGEPPPQDPQYRVEVLPCECLTLQQVMDRFQLSHIDLLKLDCEGSEFDILEGAPLSRIRSIVGEYHGFARWEEFRMRVFAKWDYGHMSRAGDMGNFHLKNPAFVLPTNVQKVQTGLSDGLASLTRRRRWQRVHGVEANSEGPFDAALCNTQVEVQYLWERLPEGGSLLFKTHEGVEEAMKVLGVKVAFYHSGGLWELMKGPSY
jgi:FkbM family methyltransferase